MPVAEAATPSFLWDRAKRTAGGPLHIAFSSEKGEAALLVSQGLNAAMGTSIPSYWIVPDTFEVALAWAQAVRRDPVHLDPDVVIINEAGEARAIEFKMRIADVPHPYEGLLVAGAEQMLPLGAGDVGHEDLTTVGTGASAFRLPSYAVEHPAHEGEPESVTHDDPTRDENGDRASVATVASDIKRVSGLSDQALAAIFPVSREHYWRWRTGREHNPTYANLRQLLALQYLLQDLDSRVADVRTWLLHPSPKHAGSSPYELLVRGRLEAVGELVTSLPTSKRSQLYLAEDGSWVSRFEGAVAYDHTPDDSPPIPLDDDES